MTTDLPLFTEVPDESPDPSVDPTAELDPGYRIFRYKALVRPTVEKRLEEVFGLCAELFNAAIDQRQTAWRRERRLVTFGEQSLDLPAIRAADPAYAALSAAMLQDVLKRVAHSTKTVIRQRKAVRPAADVKPRTGKTYPSLTLRHDAWDVAGRWVALHGIGRVKAFWSRPLQGTPLGLTIKRDPAGDWWISVICRDVPPAPLAPSGQVVGLDMGLESFATTSDGTHLENPRLFTTQLHRSRKAHRRVNRRAPGGQRHADATRLLAKRYRAVRSARRDFHFKTAAWLCERYDRIAIETLGIEGMATGYLAKSVRDAAWAAFFNVLGQTARKTGRTVTAVNARGTSQDCSACGSTPEAHERKTLREREHVCPRCEYRAHRDVNAARNIRLRGEILWNSNAAASGPPRRDGNGIKTAEQTGALPPTGSRRRVNRRSNGSVCVIHLAPRRRANDAQMMQMRRRAPNERL